MISKQKKAIFFALLAAVLYAINSPFSKLLLDKIRSEEHTSELQSRI